MMVIVARSKMVPDYAFTMHFLHLIVTSFYARTIPSTLFWWTLQFASTSLLTALGVWLCQWRELKPVFGFGKSAGDARAGSRADADVEASAPLNGRARTRGTDEPGDYELAGMERK
jgi:protein SYS1